MSRFGGLGIQSLGQQSAYGGNQFNAGADRLNQALQYLASLQHDSNEQRKQREFQKRQQETAERKKRQSQLLGIGIGVGGAALGAGLGALAAGPAEVVPATTAGEVATTAAPTAATTATTATTAASAASAASAAPLSLAPSAGAGVLGSSVPAFTGTTAGLTAPSLSLAGTGLGTGLGTGAVSGTTAGLTAGQGALAGGVLGGAPGFAGGLSGGGRGSNPMMARVQGSGFDSYRGAPVPSALSAPTADATARSTGGAAGDVTQRFPRGFIDRVSQEELAQRGPSIQGPTPTGSIPQTGSPGGSYGVVGGNVTREAPSRFAQTPNGIGEFAQPVGSQSQTTPNDFGLPAVPPQITSPGRRFLMGAAGGLANYFAPGSGTAIFNQLDPLANYGLARQRALDIGTLTNQSLDNSLNVARLGLDARGADSLDRYRTSQIDARAAEEAGRGARLGYQEQRRDRRLGFQQEGSDRRQRFGLYGDMTMEGIRHGNRVDLFNAQQENEMTRHYNDLEVKLDSNNNQSLLLPGLLEKQWLENTGGYDPIANTPFGLARTADAQRRAAGAPPGTGSGSGGIPPANKAYKAFEAEVDDHLAYALEQNPGLSAREQAEMAVSFAGSAMKKALGNPDALDAQSFYLETLNRLYPDGNVIGAPPEYGEWADKIGWRIPAGPGGFPGTDADGNVYYPNVPMPSAAWKRWRESQQRR